MLGSRSVSIDSKGVICKGGKLTASVDAVLLGVFGAGELPVPQTDFADNRVLGAAMYINNSKKLNCNKTPFD